MTAAFVVTACSGTPETPPLTCEVCRGFDDVALRVGTPSSVYDVPAFVPLSAEHEVVLTLAPAGFFTLRVAIEADGLCMQESLVEYSIVGCDPASANCGGDESLHGRWTYPREYLRAPAVFSMPYCPYSARGEPLTFEVNVSEEPGGLCSEVRSSTATFSVVPVCPEAGSGLAGFPERMDLHECCDLECFSGGGCFPPRM